MQKTERLQRAAGTLGLFSTFFGRLALLFAVVLVFDQQQLTTAAMTESHGSTRKRMHDEDVDGLVQQKSLRSVEAESESSSTSSGSSSSTSLSSDDEQTASSDDTPVPFGPLQDSLHFHSQVDALRC